MHNRTRQINWLQREYLMMIKLHRILRGIEISGSFDVFSAEGENCYDILLLKSTKALSKWKACFPFGQNSFLTE